jgi:hypothetical protein
LFISSIVLTADYEAYCIQLQVKSWSPRRCHQKEGNMAKTTSDKPSASAEEALKRRKKQARQEAKLMLAIEEANKDLKRAQKKQAKAQALVEAQSAQVQTLEAHMALLRAPGPEPEMVAPPQSAELEYQQEPSETGSSTSTATEPAPSIVEEVTVSEVTVVTSEVTEVSEVVRVHDDEIGTATEPAPTPTTPMKEPAHRTATTRKPTVTKRPASRSQSTRQSSSEAE